MKLLAAILTILPTMAFGQAPADAKMKDLKDGFVRVETASYTIEVPKGWTVSRETSFGQRTMEGNRGTMTAMTAAGGGSQGWERLYRTSLWFISREMPNYKATPYKLSKTSQGYEAASFSMLDDKGFAKARYVLLKAPNGNLLALSVKIPGKSEERELVAQFDRLIRTAVVR